MNNFRQLPTTRKGEAGEQIAKKIFMDRGAFPYAPAIDGPHPIDFAVMSKKGNITLVDVKTYPRRYMAPQTGIDKADWESYQALHESTGLRVYLMFIDAFEQCIYGAGLDVLKPTAKVEGDKVYFDLCYLQPMAKLSAEGLSKIGPIKSPERYKGVTPFFEQAFVKRHG